METRIKDGILLAYFEGPVFLFYPCLGSPVRF